MIDPAVDFLIGFGSTGGCVDLFFPKPRCYDKPSASANDSQGNVYITGLTFGSDFPLKSPLQSQPGTIFLAKLSADGRTLAFATYLGGSGLDRANAIALDGSGNIWIAGSTTSLDFPVRNALQPTVARGTYANPPNNAACFPHGFITKINSSGSAFIFELPGR